MSNQYYLPTIPYTAIDAINRVAASQGSVGYAMQAANANYNGHHIRVSYNEYRGYWITEYQWGERVVLCRGTLEQCVHAAIGEYARGALGTSVSVYIPTKSIWDKPIPEVSAEERADLANLGFREGKEDVTKASWWTWKHEEAGWAYRNERQGFPGTIAKLIQAETPEAYKASRFSRAA